MTALINYGLHYSQRWPIRDLSPTGAYVEMPGRSLKAGAMVEFVLRLQRHEQSLDLRLPARVVRVDEAGAALSFGGYDDPTYTELVNLLYSD
ncbi:MAG: PilZ domain-containing protein [Pseudomonadota bacterium]